MINKYIKNVNQVQPYRHSMKHICTIQINKNNTTNSGETQTMG